MGIRAVIFDFGGVLVRTEDVSGRRKWERKLGIPPGTLDQLVFASEIAQRSMVGQATQQDVWSHIAARYELDDATLQQMRRDFWSGDRLDQELVQFLRRLRPRYKTAILSNAWPGARRTFTERFRLHEVVDTFIISSEEGVAKPDPRIYQVALQRLDVRPDEAIFVDDFPENVATAQQLGIVAVLFRSTQQAIAEVQHHLNGAP
ncbi:MAG: HAD family phosphatase [Anaerolineae bacterium]|nr:HAD family phosphatase [Anaerolineae bacterium]MDW8070555.1 HAD family phosphatase [Anaerolineae bacterium]